MGAEPERSRQLPTLSEPIFGDPQDLVDLCAVQGATSVHRSGRRVTGSPGKVPPGCPVVGLVAVEKKLMKNSQKCFAAEIGSRAA